jgi:hypothetical protein
MNNMTGSVPSLPLSCSFCWVSSLELHSSRCYRKISGTLVLSADYFVINYERRQKRLKETSFVRSRESRVVCVFRGGSLTRIFVR